MKATINDVARLSGVSKKTVSRVINRSPLLSETTRERVQQVIDELGYVPNPQARALALGRNFLIGLIHDNPNSQMVLGVQQGILDALRGSDFELVVRPVDRRSPAMLDDVRAFLERQRLFGVVLLPPISENDALAQVCEESGCRYTRMGSAMLDVPERMVASDDQEAVRGAVEFLVAQGHRRIGFVEGPQGFRSAKERRIGFEAALGAAGLSLAPAHAAQGDYRFASGLEAGRKLLGATPRPTAIFASNDEMAAGVLHAALQMGLAVPRDLSIIGFDDTAIAAHIWPPLTTVRWPILQMAYSAAMKLIGDPAAEAEGPAHQSRFPSALIQRASVAPPAE